MQKISEMKLVKKRSSRIWIALLIILFLLAGISFLIYRASIDMFTGNPRFTLNHVQVINNGFWKDKEKMLCEILSVKPGKTNLFTLNPGEMRKTLLQRESTIEYARIQRILPDTLQIHITERIPIALIRSQHSRQVVSKDNVLMDRDRCLRITDDLPVIRSTQSFADRPFGSIIPEIKDAVKLLSLVSVSYPQIRFLAIMQTRQKLICFIRYSRNYDTQVHFTVEMPLRDQRLHMRALLTVLERQRNNPKQKKHIILLFDNQIILKDH